MLRLLPLRVDSPAARVRAGALVLVASVGAYLLVQHLAVAIHTEIPPIPATPVDAAIPFIGWALIPYASLGLLLLMVSARIGPERFVRLRRASLVSQAVAYPVFLLWPMAAPRSLPCDGSMDRFAVWIIAATDLPVNTVPSLHVAYAVIASLALPRGMYLVWGLLVAVSVLPMKQHLLLDVVTGAILGAIAWRLSRASIPQCDSPPAGTPPREVR